MRGSSAFKRGRQEAAGAASYKRFARRKRYRGNMSRGAKATRDYLYSRKGTNDNLVMLGKDWETANDTQRNLRRAIGYKGDGDYTSFARYIPRGLGAIGGYALGGAKGAAKGWQVGANVSKAFGWGDYTQPSGVVTNDIVGQSENQMAIQVNPSNNSGDIIFSHTEFVGNVIVPGVSTAGSGQVPSPFDVQSFALNPGQEAVFPFLSQLAKQFEMFEFNGLMFQYKPLSGESANATNALGKVILATNYDPSATEFQTSHSMENYDYASSSKPSSGQVHGVETAPDQRLTRQLYVQTKVSSPGPAAAGHKDKMLTDLGLFQIATEGVPVGVEPTIIGELWVSYRVKLSRAALTKTLEHKDLEFSAIELQCNAASSVAINAVNHHPSNTLSMYAHGAGELMNFAFPQNIQTGVYKITVLLYRQGSFSSSGFKLGASNVGYITETGWTLADPSSGVTSIIMPNMISSSDGLGVPLVWESYVRLDQPGRDLTASSYIQWDMTGTSMSGSTNPLLVRILICEANGLEPLTQVPESAGDELPQAWP